MPIKRDERIAPLSREHHGALLFSWKIRQGLKLGIAAERILGYVDWFWKEQLQPHHLKEEQYLFHPADDPLVQRALEEHLQIHDDIAALLVAKDFNEGMFHAIANLLEQHVRFEERVLFPHLEKIIPDEDLVQIGAILHQEENDINENYTDEFWVKQKP
jgi:hemerythrin-like domain-containing protein